MAKTKTYPAQQQMRVELGRDAAEKTGEQDTSADWVGEGRVTGKENRGGRRV